MLIVRDFYEKYVKSLGLELLSGKEGFERVISVAEVHRAGLTLTGYLKGYADKRLLIFGKVEMEYLDTLSSNVRRDRLKAIFTKEVPAVIIARNYEPFSEMLELCTQEALPLFRVDMPTMNCVSRLTLILNDEFAPVTSQHGTFVEVFDIGVLIEGDSSIGKSETALGLLERGHRLISDDVVRIKRKSDNILIGHGVELTRHHMEIRGIGIINVANLYGAFCVRDQKRIDIIVKLEEWSEKQFYDRLGTEERYCTVLDVNIPYTVLPVKPGRDVVLLLESIALNHRLKKMGYHSAKEFQNRLSQSIESKTRQNTNKLGVL